MTQEMLPTMINRGEYMVQHVNTPPDMMGHMNCGERDMASMGGMEVINSSRKRESRRLPESNLLPEPKKPRSKSYPFICTQPNCGEKFSSNEQLDIHHRIHVGVKPFACDICGKICQTENKLESHKLSHANDNVKPACDICERTFSSRSALNKHKKILHKPKPHICPQCNHGFEKRKYLLVHAKRAHYISLAEGGEEIEQSLDFAMTSFNGEENPSMVSRELKKDDFMTSLATFNRKTELEAPVPASVSRTPSVQNTEKEFTLTAESENPNMCKSSDVLSMQPVVIPVTYLCHLCTSTFPSQGYLKQHMAVHEGEKLFMCHVCGSRFHSELDLSSHQRSHHYTDGKMAMGGSVMNSQDTSDEYIPQGATYHHMEPMRSRYSCTACTEQFANLGSLKRHQAKAHHLTL